MDSQTTNAVEHLIQSLSSQIPITGPDIIYHEVILMYIFQTKKNLIHRMRSEILLDSSKRETEYEIQMYEKIDQKIHSLEE